MKKALLILTLLPSLFTSFSTAKATQFYDYSPILGWSNTFIDIKYLGNFTGGINAYGEDSNSKNIKMPNIFSFKQSGFRIGVRSFFETNPELLRFFILNPYVAFVTNELSVGSKYNTNNFSGDYGDRPIASSPTTLVGVELGIASGAESGSLSYVVIDTSKNLKNYKALGIGVKLGHSFNQKIFMLNIELGWKYFTKADWKEAYESSFYKYNSKGYRVKGLNSFNTFTASVGFSF